MSVPDGIFPRSRWWWLGLCILLAVAAWLYLPGYDTSLPYIDNPNEPAFNLAAQTIIDTGSARSISFDAYPPGIISLNYLLIKHGKADGAHFASVLPTLRLTTIAAWLAAVALIALIGAGVADPPTGLIAAAIWGVNPWVVAVARFAEANGYVTCFALLSLWLALNGALGRRGSFSSAAIYCLMLAALFKTQALFIAPLIWALPLINIRREPAIRARALRLCAWNAVRLSLFLFWLLLLYPTLEADRIPFWVAPSSSLAIPSPQTLSTNLAPVLEEFFSREIWLVLVALASLLMRFRRLINPTALVAVITAALAWLVGVSLFGGQDSRQFYFLGALLSILSALGFRALMVLIEGALARPGIFAGKPGWRRGLASALLALILLIVLAPAFLRSQSLAYRFTLQDRRNDLAHYMDRSLEPALFVTNYDNHKTLNRSWGGYAGAHDFPKYPENALLSDKPIEEWRALGVEYAIMPHWLMLEDPDIYYPEETLLLKTYPVDPNFRGPDMVVLRLHPMQHETDLSLSPIRLLGYDISTTRLAAGEDIAFRHYWRASSPPNAAHHIFNHLLDGAGDLVAQVDGAPLWDARRDTTTWDDPAELLLGREFVLTPPPELEPGAYKLISGLYDPATGQRLLAADGADHLTIAAITIARP